MAFKKEVASASIEPEEAFAWVCKVQELNYEEFEVSGKFFTLDCKISAALSKIAHGELARQISVLEENAATKEKLDNIQTRLLVSTVLALQCPPVLSVAFCARYSLPSACYKPLSCQCQSNI